MRFYELLLEYNEERLVHDFGDKLVKRYGDVRATPEAIVKAIAALDPTPNKELTFWLAMNYANEGISRWEDISSRAVPALLKFKALLRKPNLQPPLPVRDMNQIKGLSALEDITEQYAEKESVSNREQASTEEQKFYDDGAAELLYNDAQIKVVIPKTVAAAQFFGKGTRWCTASKDDNRFAYYNKKGPLYIVMLKGTNAKYQFHWESDQFMDTKDEGINPNKLAEKYPILWKIFNPIAIKNKSLVLNQHPTEAVQLAAVQQNGRVIQYIKNPSEAVQLAAVQQYGWAIQYLKNPSEAIQLAAVQENGLAIEYLKNPSEAIQLAAVQKYGSAIHYLKNPSEAVQLAAVQKYGLAIKYLKNPSEAVQLAAVQQNRWAIKNIKHPTDKVKALQKKVWES